MCMDRPVPVGSADKSKEYVQPQYIIDSINNLFLLPTKPYAPGIAAPAHLSPFVDNEEEGYLPDRQREINSLAGIESNIAGPTFGDDSDDNEEKEEAAAGEEAGAASKGKGDVDTSSDEGEGTSEELSDSEEEDKPLAKTKGKRAAAAVVAKPTAKTAKKI